MSNVSASYLYSGMSDFFSGYGCNDNQSLLYAFYGPRTTLRDIVDQLVSETWSGPASEDVPEDLSNDEVRAAILDCLTEQGRADYASGAISEFAEKYAAANDLDGEEEDDDCMDSPVVIFLLEWEACADCGAFTELNEDEVCAECAAGVPPVTVTKEELEANGYVEIVEQNDDGSVVILNGDGGCDLFQVRDSYAGWCLECECGRVLEFCRSLSRGGNF